MLGDELISVIIRLKLKFYNCVVLFGSFVKVGHITSQNLAILIDHAGTHERVGRNRISDLPEEKETHDCSTIAGDNNTLKIPPVVVHVQNSG